MATPAGQGYRSPLNLGLDQIPRTSNPELFQEMIPVYNAIHTLNAYLDNIRLSLVGGDPEATPAQEMRFTRAFWGTASEAIPQGKVITVTSTGIKLGAGKRVRNLPGGGQIVDCFLTGVAMTTAAVGEVVRFGIGPAVVKVTGFKIGDQVWATPAGGSFAGEYLTSAAAGAVRIGLCIQDDFIMVIPDYLNL